MKHLVHFRVLSLFLAIIASIFWLSAPAFAAITIPVPETQTTTVVTGTATTSLSVFSGDGLRAGLAPVKENLRGKGITTSDSITLVVLGWIHFALPYAGLLAFVGLIYGGFLYVATGIDEKGADKAKTILKNSAIGIILIFSAYAIVSTIIRASS